MADRPSRQKSPTHIVGQLKIATTGDLVVLIADEIDNLMNASGRYLPRTKGEEMRRGCAGDHVFRGERRAERDSSCTRSPTL